MNKLILEVGEVKPLASSKATTFSVSKGEVICLFGKNGSGKTLLLKSICGVHEYLSGSINKLYSRSEYGVCLQFPEHLIFNEKVITESNLICGDLLTAKSVLARLNLNENQNPFTLSDGQKRLLFLYGLLATKSFLIFDEPLASLDNLTKIDVIGDIKSAKLQNKSILYTANRVKDTEFADNIITLG